MEALTKWWAGLAAMGFAASTGIIYAVHFPTSELEFALGIILLIVSYAGFVAGARL